MYRILLITVFGAGLFVFVPSAIFMQIEQWTYWEAAYYCAITLISIGFGDFVPGYGDGQHAAGGSFVTFIADAARCVALRCRTAPHGNASGVKEPLVD